MRLAISLEPKWYDLIPEAGIRVLADPAVTDIMDSAREDERLKDLTGDEALLDTIEPGKASKLARVLSLVVAEQVIRDWEGVEDETGTKAKLTPDHIAAFLRHPQVDDAWLLYYMQHWLQVGETITSEKKRLCALAEWHFSGGAQYCSACPSKCKDCPQRQNQPQTQQGKRLWQVVMRLGGQVQATSTMNGYVVVGWDMVAALKIADGLGANPYLAALILPEVEQTACSKINERLQAHG